MAAPAPMVPDDRLGRVAAFFEDFAFTVIVISAVALVAAIVALFIAF